MIRQLYTKRYSCQLKQMTSLGAGLYGRLAGTQALPLGGLEMASRRGFWLRIDVFELLEGDSQYKNLRHDV